MASINELLSFNDLNILPEVIPEVHLNEGFVCFIEALSDLHAV